MDPASGLGTQGYVMDCLRKSHSVLPVLTAALSSDSPRSSPSISADLPASEGASQML